MPAYEFLIWDLDGTIINSSHGILTSVQYALDQLGNDPLDAVTLRKFIGPPLKSSFQKLAGLDSQTAQKAVALYRENFAEGGAMFRDSLYAGIMELLEHLSGLGRTQIIVTSKPEVYARQIAEHYGIQTYFSDIHGSELDGTLSVKAELMENIMTRYASVPKPGMISIGDRRYEVEAARKIGIDSIAVTYGFGDLEELRVASPTYYAGSASEIGKIVI